MLNFIYLEINIFAALVLLTIFDYTPWRYLNLEQKLFNLAVGSTIIVLFADGLSWICNGNTTTAGYIFNLVFNYVYWLASVAPAYFSMLYSIKKVGSSHLRIYTVLGLIPVILSCILILVNPITKWIFTISDSNYYQRGPYFYVVGFLPFFFVAASLVSTFIKLLLAPRYARNRHRMFILFMLVGFSGSLPQVFMYGVETIWISLALTLLMCYVYLQNGNVSTDALTKINNRRRFDIYSKYACDQIKNPDDNVYLVILDINKFKHINDEYGHAEGDRALILASEALMRVFEDGKVFFARIGGDEFAIIFRNTRNEFVQVKIAELRAQIATIAVKEQLPYELEFSIGYAYSSGRAKKPFDKVFAKADENMYRNKREIASRKAREKKARMYDSKTVRLDRLEDKNE